MDFQKVAACCADTVIIVRYAVNLLSGNGFPGNGSMWHRLVEVGTDWGYILNY